MAPPRLTAADFPREVLTLFDQYVHGAIDRRGFIGRGAAVLGSAAARFAEAHPNGNGKLGAVGFCYGGGIVNWLATQMESLRAGVPFYGAPPDLDAVPNIRAEMLVQHGGNDTRLVEGWPAHEAALKAAGVRYQGFVYPGAEHGFNNDTTPRFNAEAAALAWSRTLELFRRTLA